MRAILGIAALLLTTICLHGQALEDWIETTDYPEELQEWLQELREHPLDLNHASTDDIAKLPFLNKPAAKEIVQLRIQSGGLESFSSIDSLGFLSSTQINSLHEFTIVSDDYQMLQRASIRSSATATTDQRTRFEPSAASYRIRADFESSNGASGFIFGLRRPEQTQGFEDLSCGIELPQEDMRPRLLAGDYQIETGTGLVLATAYGMGSWLSSQDAVSVPAARGLISRPSSSRLALQRGIASEFNHGAVTGRVFGAFSRLDAQILNDETVKLTEGTSSSEELQSAREAQLEERLVGANIEYSASNIALGATAYSAGFDPEFSEREPLDPMPKFEDASLHVGSVHVRAHQGAIHMVTETASSSSGGIAHQSALAYREEFASWSIYHVYADETFFSPHSRLWGGFGEDAGNVRQTGIRTILRGSGYQFTLGGSTDRTPFRTSTSPLRKSGDRVSAQLRVYPGSTFEISSLVDRRWAELTSNPEPSIAKRSDRARLEMMLHGSEEYKIRLELKSATRSSGRRHVLGTLAFFQVKTALLGMRLYSRIAMWNIEHSDASMSLYENSVYGAYPLVSLSGTGRRASILIQKDWNPLKIGAKLGHLVVESLNDSHETIDFALEISYRH